MSDEAPRSDRVEEASESPLADGALTAARADLEKLWKRIARRAPDDVRARVEATLARVGAVVGREDAGRAERLELARALEDLGGELRGRRIFEPAFYVDGRLGIVRAHEPVMIQGAIDHLSVERFFDRYLKRAEQAFERLEYFMTRAGLLQKKERATKPAWEQPYAQFEQYHELIWGKMRRTPSKPPTPKRGGGS